jgi:predicted membrane channel-forming protein YqfA (hemolysin III family)
MVKYFSELKQAVQIKIQQSGEGIASEFSHLLEVIHQREKQWTEIYIASGLKEQTEALPKWPLYVMLFGGVFCLSCSGIFHLFCAHSEKVNNYLNRLDYAGIAILIVGSCYPPNYYLFYCQISKFLLS